MNKHESAYIDQLHEQYPAAIVDQIREGLDNPQHAELVDTDGKTVSYLHVKPEEPTDKPAVVYFNGFCETEWNKLPLAAEFVEQGYEFMIAGQNRDDMIHDGNKKKNAAATLGAGILDAAEHALPKRERMYVAHSYGAIALSESVWVLPEKFKGTDVVLLAPAGVVPNETYPKLGKRWLNMMGSEGKKDKSTYSRVLDAYTEDPEDPQARPMTTPDPKNVTGGRSFKTLIKKFSRTRQEVKDLRHKTTDLRDIAGVANKLVVVTYAEDEMYPDEQLESTLGELLRSENAPENFVWVTPAATRNVRGSNSGENEYLLYAGHGAVHDDEQFNQKRVVDAVVDAIK